jgi:lipopolysaccharide export LptBFGC system permease protein LptF
MKLLLSTLVLIFIFSGCSTKRQNHRLRTKNAQQSAIIQQQKAQINTLRTQLKSKKAAKKIATKARVKRQKPKVSTNTNAIIPQAPKKEIKLKKVEDTNYSSNYMYPGATKKPSLPKVTTDKTKITQSKKDTSSTMSKTECISMIGADKFAKYTQMFGSESASIKRCKMLKAMKH